MATIPNQAPADAVPIRPLLTDQIEDLQKLQKAAQKITSILDLDQLIDNIVNDVARSFGLLETSVYLHDEARGDMVMGGVHGCSLHSKGFRLKIGEEGMVGYVASTGQMRYAPDVHKDEYYIGCEPSTNSEVAIPLRVGEHLVGVFTASHPDLDAFPRQQLRVLQALCDHVAYTDQLAREFPAIDVDPDPIFVRSSATVWTAAGVSAGIDLALALVEDDHGTEVAQTVARWLVLYLRRPGGQTQFAAPVWVARAKREPIRAVQDAVESEPGGAHSIGELARRAAMSPRHFTRVFTDEVGEAPGAYVERVRTEAARRQLEQTDDTVVAIAARCGFGTPETMRRNFIRRIGVSPDQYRKTFA